jgi:hypothetical protein
MKTFILALLVFAFKGGEENENLHLGFTCFRFFI